MAVEIERKFLVRGDAWRRGAVATEYRQGYLAIEPQCSIRVRVADEQAWLTIKSGSQGIARQEFEYPVPQDDAAALLGLCLPGVISKTRHVLTHGGHCWEVDEFHGDNTGLIVAEIELESVDEVFDKPEWLGEEVSDDPRYYNATLSVRPYCRWKDDV